MSSGLFHIEEAAGTVSDTQFFEGNSAFKSFGVTRTQRLYGFAGCYALALVLSIVGTAIEDGITFTILYAFGLIISVIGTGFLAEFSIQRKLMFKRVRILATIVVLLMIGTTPICIYILFLGTRAPCVVFVILQYVAFFWYTLSYMPSAYSTALKVFSKSEP